jgi:hypothetical protein
MVLVQGKEKRRKRRGRKEEKKGKNLERSRSLLVRIQFLCSSNQGFIFDTLPNAVI